MPNLNSRNILLIAFFTSLVSAVVMITLFVTIKPNTSQISTPIANKLKSFVLDEEEKLDTDTAILLMGYGGAGHSGGGLTDANLLVHLDNQTEKLTIIAIPRDLWVQIPIRSDISENHKINAAFAIGRDDNRYGLKQPEFKGMHGGGNMSKFVASKVLGVEIDYYAAIDFLRFENAIDAIDGITVEVPVSFKDGYFPIPGNEELLCGFSPEYNAEINANFSGFELEKKYECRYETLEFNSGPKFMDGKTTLKFVRSRHSDNHGGDFARGERAQAVLVAIGNKLVSLGGVSKVDDFYEEFRIMVTSDIDENAILEILTKHPNITDYDLKKLNIDSEFVSGSTSSDGQSILVPKSGMFDFSEIQNYINSNISKK